MLSELLNRSDLSTDPGPWLPVYDAIYYWGRAGIILCLAWLADGSLRRIGIGPWRWAVHLPVAVGLTLLAAGLSRLSPNWLKDVHLLSNHRSPSRLSLFPAWTRIPYVMGGAFAQELFYRGFLISRLRQLLGNYGGAILASSLMFASLYLSSPRGMVLALAVGLFYAGAFTLTRSLWPSLLASLLLSGFTLVEETIRQASRGL